MRGPPRAARGGPSTARAPEASRPPPPHAAPSASSGPHEGGRLASRALTKRGLAKCSGALAFLLLAIYVAQAAPGIPRMAPTFDEPAHIGSGFSYLKTGEIKLNLQHPPLLKDIAAVPLLMGGIRWPVRDVDWVEAGPDPVPFMQWEVGSSVLYSN